MDAADFFTIQVALLEKNRLMWEQQRRGPWDRATREWFDALHPLRKFFVLELSPTLPAPLWMSLNSLALQRTSLH